MVQLVEICSYMWRVFPTFWDFIRSLKCVITKYCYISLHYNLLLIYIIFIKFKYFVQYFQVLHVISKKKIDAVDGELQKLEPGIKIACYYWTEWESRMDYGAGNIWLHACKISAMKTAFHKAMVKCWEAGCSWGRRFFEDELESEGGLWKQHLLKSNRFVERIAKTETKVFISCWRIIKNLEHSSTYI